MTTCGARRVIVDEPEERALALRLLGYEAALREAAARYSPHRLCTYLYELATDFTVFYEHCPVLARRATSCGRAAWRSAS